MELIENIFIPTYVVNLRKRVDRLAHIKREFAGREEFKVTYIEAVEDTIGALGLWKSLVKVIHEAKNAGDELIIFCEDDHQFTANYSKQKLFEIIQEGYKLNAELLIGGSSGGFKTSLPVSENLLWVQSYCSNQFLVIYKRFFDIILRKTDFDPKKKVDNTISDLALSKFVIVPYLSNQKCFYYSDVTMFNQLYPENQLERFTEAEQNLGKIMKIYQMFRSKLT